MEKKYLAKIDGQWTVSNEISEGSVVFEKKIVSLYATEKLVELFGFKSYSSFERVPDGNRNSVQGLLGIDFCDRATITEWPSSQVQIDDGEPILLKESAEINEGVDLLDKDHCFKYSIIAKSEELQTPTCESVELYLPKLLNLHVFDLLKPYKLKVCEDAIDLELSSEEKQQLLLLANSEVFTKTSDGLELEFEAFEWDPMGEAIHYYIYWKGLAEIDDDVPKNFPYKAVLPEKRQDYPYGEFVDLRDGHHYKTIKIGDQVWMAENLAYKAEGGCWALADDPWCVKERGYLYDFETVKKACPPGWHIPTQAEFDQLFKYVGGKMRAGKMLKSINFGGQNEYGFSLIGSGYKDFNSTQKSVYSRYRFDSARNYLWSSTESEDLINVQVFEDGKGSVRVENQIKSHGFSLRCVQGEAVAVPEKAPKKKIVRKTKAIEYDPSLFVIRDKILVKYLGQEKDVVVPEGVTTIGTDAFRDCTTIESVVVPGSVKNIENSAFYGCSSLKSVALPETLKKLGPDVFNGCAFPEYLCFETCEWTFKNSIAIKRGYACYCTNANAKHLVFPEEVAFVGAPNTINAGEGFIGYKALESFTLPRENMIFYKHDFSRCSFKKDFHVNCMNSLKQACEITDQMIIERGRLCKYTGLDSKEVAIPDVVTYIASGAFNGCKLESLTHLPSNVHIYADAFEDCNFSPDFYIESRNFKLQNCLLINDSTVIGGLNSKVKKIIVPDGVTKIFSLAHTIKSACEEVSIPETVKDILPDAFCKCSFREDFYLKSFIYTFENALLIQNNTVIGVTNSDLEVYRIPEGVAEIGLRAFESAKKMKDIVLPASVKKIDPGAFMGCGMKYTRIFEIFRNLGNKS